MSSSVVADPQRAERDEPELPVARRRHSIEAKGLGKTYELFDRPQDRLAALVWPRARRKARRFTAVRGVDLAIEPGECVGVVGRNGSGKSTLLNMICGLLEPSEGEVSVRGRVAPILTLGAGFSPEFTGRENVLLNSTVLGLSRAEARARMPSIIEFADLGEFFDQPVKRYSSGMYSRLAFASAISIDPEVLVMDEVLAVGDEAFTRKCFARIEEIKRAGATVLFASHAPNLVIELCDRALLMDDGECLLQSDPKTVISSYHRLLYCEPERRTSVREEIRAAEDLPAEGVAERRPDPAPAIDFGRYDPELLPESTVEYGVGGARIENPRILDPAGQPVNVLHAGAEYRYAYDVRFDESAHRVRFGMMIKLVTGFELAGQASHPLGEALDKVDAGQVVRVEFSFVPRLIAGAYFMNAGVLALEGEEEVYLHRIVDALMFRIMPHEGSRVTGVTDLSGAQCTAVQLDDARTPYS